MVINPLDFFVEDYAEYFPFTYEPALAADLSPYLRPVDDSAEAAAWRRHCPPLPDEGRLTVHFLSDLNAAVNGDVAYSVRMEAGVQTPDHTLTVRDRLVPRQRLAAGQPAAAVRPGGPVRLRLPRPAGLRPRRHDRARRAERPAAGLHRPPRLGRGVHPRRRLGRPRPDVGALRRRGPHPALGDPAPERRRADRGRHRAGRRDLLLPQRGTPDPRGPARHPPLHRRPVDPHRRARRGRRRAAGRGRRTPDHGRRADLRLPRRRHHRAVEHRRRRCREARARERPRRAAARDLRPGRGRAPRPGQVVPR